MLFRSHVQLSVTLWMVACQDPLSMGLFSLEYWSVLSFPSPGDLPDPGIEPGSPALQADDLLHPKRAQNTFTSWAKSNLKPIS